VHFEWEGKAWESVPVPKAPEDIPAGYPKAGGFGVMPVRAFKRDLLKYEAPRLIAEFLPDYADSPTVLGRIVYPYRYDFLYTNRFDMTTIRTSYDYLRSMFIEHTHKFYAGALEGSINIDAQWDDYVKEWLEWGGDDYIRMLEKFPITGEFLKGNLVY
jgi:hypothetical protein